MPTVRDFLWVWGHEAGSHNTGWNIPQPSRMTPAEGAFFLGVPNLIMVKYGGKPAPPLDQYAVPLRALDRVVWSIVGAGGDTSEQDRAAVLDLATRMPNLTGVMMDDFFKAPGPDGQVGSLSLEQLERTRSRLTVADRRLDLWVVWYDQQLDLPVRDHLALCDRISFWTGEARRLDTLQENFARVEKVAPKQAKVLGCYMWDYGGGRPMPLDAMKMQCQTGLRWLKDGRIQGMIFLASCICDVGLETVEWTRRWIAEVADQPLTT